MKHDVIVVGGGYAGMAAALQLLRARKTVLMLDAGKRRNRFANSSHGFLGQDGIAPDRIAADAREGRDGKPNALLKVIAGMIGVGFDDLKQREAARLHRRVA